MVNLLDVVKSCKSFMTEEDFSPIENNITEEIRQGIESLDKDIKDFYNTNNALSPYCYLSDIDYVEIFSFDKEALEMMKIKECIEFRAKEFRNYIKNGEWVRYFTFLDKKVSLIMLKRHIDEIPEKDRYEVFRTIYTRNDFGFNNITKELMDKILKEKPKRIKGLKDLPFDEDGYIIIYRGANKDSTPLDKTYSWTAKFYTALWFANRFTGKFDGIVYQAKVHKGNIIDYITNRGEHEIIVKPEHVMSITDLELLNAEEFITEVQEYSCMLELYQYNANERGLAKLFIHPSEIHGITHTKRVLMHCLFLAYLKDLDDDDIEVLVNSAKYHDIGREHDGVCFSHGLNSFQIVEKKGLLEDNEDKEIIRFIIENHCLDDEEGLDRLNRYNIEDKTRAEFLYNLFKDADALDRVRVRDLDIQFLRNKEAKRLCNVAESLLRAIE